MKTGSMSKETTHRPKIRNQPKAEIARIKKPKVSPA